MIKARIKPFTFTALCIKETKACQTSKACVKEQLLVTQIILYYKSYFLDESDAYFLIFVEQGIERKLLYLVDCQEAVQVCLLIEPKQMKGPYCSQTFNFV